MRLSTLAALMILTTIMLSACSQQQVAQVIDNSGEFFGRDSALKYANLNHVPANSETAFKYQDSANYTVEAEIGSVSTQDLPPPPTALPVSSAGSASKKFTVISHAQPINHMPISQAKITSTTSAGFEWPVQGIAKPAPNGEGIIIAATEGKPIRAAADGTVIYVENNVSDFGNIAILQHADGMMTSYAHAREILVSKGDQIHQGDLLGYVGKTGNALSPQLGFGMRVADASVNPLDYLPQSVASR